jgi:hypothetical protein
MPVIQIGGHRGGNRAVVPVYSEIDEDDVERVSKYKWGQNNHSNPNTLYAQSIIEGRKVHLHRFIMGLGDYKDDKRVVNHIDCNGLNNKKSNLEICDTLYNSQSFRKNNEFSNVGCVYYDTTMKRLKRYRASIIINKVKQSKRFLTEAEAYEWINKIVEKDKSMTYKINEF